MNLVINVLLYNFSFVCDIIEVLPYVLDVSLESRLPSVCGTKHVSVALLFVLFLFLLSLTNRRRPDWNMPT